MNAPFRASRYGSMLAILSLAANAALPAADRTWAYTYNNAGQVLSANGPRPGTEDIIRYAYDSKGNLTTTTNALGHVTRMALYNERGLPGHVTDPNGVVTLIQYDEVGRVTERITRHPGGNPDFDAHYSYAYDAITNRLAFTANSAGIWESFDYDDAGRLILQRNSSAEIRFTHDKLGNTRTIETWELDDDDGHDDLSTRTTWRYDELGRRIHELGNSGQAFSTRYDKKGNVIAVSDALGHSTVRSYDALDRMTTEQDQLNHQATYSYDARDNTVEVSDRRQLSTTYNHDGHDNRTQLASPDTGTTAYTFDEAGNLLSAMDAQGYQVLYTYDALNRLVSVTYPEQSSKNVNYTYDSAPSCNYCIGRLASISDSSGITRFSYDFMGRIISRTNIVSIPGGQPLHLTTTFSYDPSGRPTGIGHPNGETIHYDWGRLDSFEEGEASLEPGDYIWSVRWTDRSGSTTRALADFIDFDPYGPVTYMRYGNGLELDRDFDRDGRLRTQSVGDLQELEYHYDPRDLVTLIEDQLEPTRSEAFNYDPTGRLLSASGLYGDITYAYDANGNRTEKTVSHFTGDSQETYEYSTDSNRLDTLSIESGASLREFEFTYDARGNLEHESEAGTTRMTTTHGADNRMDSIAP